jgi:hypothetical protein
MEAILFKDQVAVVAALEHIRARLPFTVLGLDSDNGSEFINETLINYCKQHEITFTRSRPYKKNDQCYVEQKNGHVIRRNVGYDRYEGLEACRELNTLYESLRTYNNYWQPSMKLVWKHRVSAKVIKRYDKAQTPHDRLASCPQQVSQNTIAALTSRQKALDPVSLLRSIHWQQDRLAKLAVDVAVVSAAILETGNAAAANGGAIQTEGRHYKRSPKVRTAHDWRTRIDPFAEMWAEVELLLKKAPETTATALLEHLQDRHPGRFEQKHLRTLQRKVKLWRLSWLAEAEVGAYAPNTPNIFLEA